MCALQSFYLLGVKLMAPCLGLIQRSYSRETPSKFIV